MKDMKSNYFVQFTIAVLAVLVAWAIPSSLFLLFDNKDVFGTSVTTGAEANGVTNLTQEEGEPVKGLPSTTFSFTANGTGYTTPANAISFMANSIAGNDNLEIVNLIATGTSSDGRKFKIEFYGVSRSDYKDNGDFSKTVELLNRTLNEKVGYSHIKSVPTTEGKRNVSVSVAGAEGDNSLVTLKRNWADTLKNIIAVNEFDGNIYSVGVKKNDNVDEVASTQNIVEASFFDEGSYATAEVVPDVVWETVSTPTGGKLGADLPVARIFYDSEFTLEQSALRLVLSADAGEADKGKLIEFFRSNAQKSGFSSVPFSVVLSVGDEVNVLDVVYPTRG